MWIWLTVLLLGVCPLALSAPGEGVDVTQMDHEKLTDHLLGKLEEHFGEGWKDQVQVLKEKLEKIAELKEQGVQLNSEEIVGTEKPWESAQTILKWKKVLHKIGHVAGDVAKGVAINVAGRIIAGAIG
uniref:Heteropteran venom family 16 protein 2 n=1 Tax=Oncocephalus sp. TaxID=2944721 RepID=A0AB38ZEP4_9HEMI